MSADYESVRALVERVRAIPYGRNTNRSASGVLVEGHGTCSTKHALLAELLANRGDLDLRLMHRVYQIDRERARTLFGSAAADRVPAEGLVDVHTYATILINGRRTAVDVTFPSSVPWDGQSDMPLACGDGVDIPADDDPWAQKARLVDEHCNAALRESFIAALSNDT